MYNLRTLELLLKHFRNGVEAQCADVTINVKHESFLLTSHLIGREGGVVDYKVANNKNGVIFTALTCKGQALVGEELLNEALSREHETRLCRRQDCAVRKLNEVTETRNLPKNNNNMYTL